MGMTANSGVYDMLNDLEVKSTLCLCRGKMLTSWKCGVSSASLHEDKAAD